MKYPPKISTLYMNWKIVLKPQKNEGATLRTYLYHFLSSENKDAPN